MKTTQPCKIIRDVFRDNSSEGIHCFIDDTEVSVKECGSETQEKLEVRISECCSEDSKDPPTN